MNTRSKLSMFAFRAGDGAVRTLCLTGLFLCSCETLTPRVAFEGDVMPAAQVETYLVVLTSPAAYDTRPKFLEGYAPFYPPDEEQKNEIGYALLEFSVLTDGTTGDICGVTAPS